MHERFVLALAASVLLQTAFAQTTDGDRVAPATSAQQLELDRRQPWRAQIHAPLYGTGSGGAGITIGVADTGVDSQHPELRGRVVVGRNVAAGSFDISDRNGHGTHVSALIAGRLSADSPLAGLAPNATLAVARVFADGNSTTSDVMDRGIRWLVEGAGWDTRFVDALPTALVKPFSGSAARAMLIETMQAKGVDSFPALVAATVQGSTETTFYVLAVYFGAVGIQRVRHAVPCALLAELAGVLAAIGVCYWFFG